MRARAPCFCSKAATLATTTAQRAAPTGHSGLELASCLRPSVTSSTGPKISAKRSVGATISGSCSCRRLIATERLESVRVPQFRGALFPQPAHVEPDVAFGHLVQEHVFWLARFLGSSRRITSLEVREKLMLRKLVGRGWWLLEMLAQKTAGNL